MRMDERKYNLDLLRILSMLFIVSLHYLGVGGAFYNITDGNTELLTYNYGIASLLEALSIVGVNCFVLISGYFLVNSSFKMKKALHIYLTTLFYSVIFFIAYVIVNGFSLGNMLSSFLPISMSTYWFITVYLVLYILSPFINLLCNNMTQKQHAALLLILVIVFSVWKCVLPFAETLDTRKGYSLTWFIVLYLTGAYISRYGVQLFKRNWLNLVAYFVIAILSTGVKLSTILLSNRFPILEKGQNLFYHYDSITVYLGAVFLFVFFSRLNCEGAFWRKTVGFIAPSVFSVYLIHENFLWREFLWGTLVRANEMTQSPYFILHYFASVIIVFCACILIDQLRKGIFLLVKIIIQRAKMKRQQ